MNSISSQNLALRYTSAFLLLAVAVTSLKGQDAAEGRFARLVSPAQLTRTVKELVSLGNRQGGTLSGDRSTEYVQKRFKQMGLAASVRIDPEVRTWVHSSQTIAIESPRSLKGVVQNASVAGFSPSMSTRSFKLIAEEAFTPEAAIPPDCVILLGSIPTGQSIRTWTERGAQALIAYESESRDQNASWAKVISLRGERENPLPVFTIPVADGVRLQRSLHAGETVTIRLGVQTSIAAGTPKTLIGEVKGKTDKYVIICAHGDSDSGGPGADDNASGVAGVLEIARVLQELRRSRQIGETAVGVKFIVWGKEYHSAGAYIKQHADSLENIAAVINFDEIGYGKSRNCIYFEGNDIEANAPLLRSFLAVSEKYVGKAGFWKEATTNPSQGGTDSYAFLPRYLDRLGVTSISIPSITVFCAAWDEPRTLPQTPGWTSSAWHGHPDSVTIDYSPYYHSTLDVPKLTTEKEPFNMMWAAKAVGMVLLKLMTP